MIALILGFAMTPGADSVPDVPNRRTIERIETALSGLTGLRNVGVPTDLEAFNRASRVRIRNAICTAVDDNMATCTYQVEGCDFGKWCERTSNFVRHSALGNPLSAVRGWNIVEGPEG